MKNFEKLIKTVKTLRGPHGCPWDKEQTHESLINSFIEEVYEFSEAVYEENDDHMLEELGDTLLHVVFQADLAAERGAFDIEDVSRVIADKLISRHPHVFSGMNLKTSDEVLKHWEKAKQKEKKRKSVYEGIPKTLPPLLKLEKILEKAGKHGLNTDVSEIAKTDHDKNSDAEIKWGLELLDLVRKGRKEKIDIFKAAETISDSIRRLEDKK